MKGNSVHKKNEGSAIILVVGVLAFFLIFFFVVGIDYAFMYVAKGELQNAADSAALAGAAMLDGTSNSTYQYAARYEAATFATKNDTASQPVSLDLNTTNDPAGDIVVGNWDGSTFQVANSLTGAGFPINALKVVARRTGDNAVPLYFGGMVGWDAMDVSRVAIARMGSKGVSPIAVNEYWQGDPGGPSGAECGEYPHSYFRRTNLDGTLSNCFGEKLALAGNNAIPNSNPQDKGGYLALDYRTDSYDGYDSNVEQWYNVTDYSQDKGPSSPDKDLWAGHLDYYVYDPLVTMTEQYLPRYNLTSPEGADPDWKIYDDSGNRIYTNPISDRPFSSVMYFSGTGTGLTISEMIDDGAYRDGRYAPGREIVVLVYDGLVWTGYGSSPKRTSVVGYAKVRILGYGNRLSDALNDPFDKNAHTVYGEPVGELEECNTLDECRDLIDILSGDEVAVLVK